MSDTSSPLYLVKLCNANSPTKVAYLGGNGCHGFNVDNAVAAHRFDLYNATRFADHFRGWYRGFAGGAKIEVVPA